MTDVDDAPDPRPRPRSDSFALVALIVSQAFLWLSWSHAALLDGTNERTLEALRESVRVVEAQNHAISELERAVRELSATGGTCTATLDRATTVELALTNELERSTRVLERCGARLAIMGRRP